MSKVGKWIAAWIAATATTVLIAVLIWWLIHPGGVLNREPPQPTPPHAPPIPTTESYGGTLLGGTLHNEELLAVTVGAGAKVSLDMQELWWIAGDVPGECARGLVAFTWLVRSPYPEGGEDLELESEIRGHREVWGRGSTGSATVGMCDLVTLHNMSLEEYVVEIRYASGLLY